MIKIEKKSECSGCHACYNACPVNAIKMVEDEKGFLYPIVSEEKCIKCGFCDKICPIINKKIRENKIQCYAAINKDDEIRKDSSSGGIFNLIAINILNRNGVVFGAMFDNDFSVVHGKITSIDELTKLRKSKYVQSIIGDTYKEAKELLDNGKLVLFTGTPCQIEGLYSYLKKEYDNLYTQDIICHGVPSPKVYKKYLKYISNNDNVKNVEFRNKKYGWKDNHIAVDTNHVKYTCSNSKDIYIKAFLQNLSLRESCYNCSFKKKNRLSDITLADFWGIQNVLPEFDDDKGTSLVIVNSERGKKLFNDIKNNIKYKKVNFEDSIKYNPSMISSVKINKNRDKFFNELDSLPFDKLVKKYQMKTNIFKKVFLKVGRIAKKVLIKK